MNYFVLKGVVLNANTNLSNTNGKELKKRVFDAVAYPGFVNSTYDVIGVEFGLGMMEIDQDLAPNHEQTIAKIQIWNLNERKRFMFNYLNFLHGSRFALITYEMSQKGHWNALKKAAQQCLNKTSNANVGMIVSLNEAQNLDFIENLEDDLGIKFKIVGNIQEFITLMIASCIQMENVNFILPIHSLDEIEAVETVHNPCSNHPRKGSKYLEKYLHSVGYSVNERNHVEFTSGSYTYRLDLETLSLHVASTKCIKCPAIACRNPYKKDGAFKRICVIWDSPIKRGYTNPESGLTESDLFALSILYSIKNRKLPSSITSQFPKYLDLCMRMKRKRE